MRHGLVIHDSEMQMFGPSARQVAVGKIAHLTPERSLPLDSGRTIERFPLAFQTYGTLNEARDNAVLICHALTGDQYVASEHPVTGKPGWWQEMVGPGRVIDTDRWFVICINSLGACLGSFGPKSLNAATGKPWGLDFPVITVRDMVRAQKLLVEALGIERLACVIGGSMGGMLALEWSVQCPDAVASTLVIASAARHTAQNIAFHEIGRQAIMADPDWRGGRYLEEGSYPEKGLAVARMTAHITYLSEAAMQRKFGRALQDKDAVTYGFDADFQVESYLRHQGRSFVERYDANSYLYITRAVDYFDLAASYGGTLSEAFRRAKGSYCLVSFSSDWLYPTSESREIVRALNGVGAEVSFTEIVTDKGHDAFLLDVPDFKRVVRGFLDGREGGRP